MGGQNFCLFKGFDGCDQVMFFFGERHMTLRPSHPNDIKLLSIEAVRERKSMVNGEHFERVIEVSLAVLF